MEFKKIKIINMGDNFIFTVLVSQTALIAILIYVIYELKRHIISLEAKIYGQQLSLQKLQQYINDINKFLNLNTSKWRDLDNY